MPNLFATSYELTITNANALDRFRRPLAKGQWGGHQTLANRFQQRETNGHLWADDDELNKAYHYARAYGDGTFQEYFYPVLDAARIAGWRPCSRQIEITETKRSQVLARGHQGIRF